MYLDLTTIRSVSYIILLARNKERIGLVIITCSEVNSSFICPTVASREHHGTLESNID